MVWAESALQFTFGEDWVVRRYDAHRYYRAISGSDMKGVDFVGIYRDRFLLFIEVKNYTKRYGDALPARVPPLDNPAGFARHLGRKWQDSLRAVRVFQLVLRRRWAYRLFYPLVGRLLAAEHDWRFWTRAHQLTQTPGAVHALLWLELADRYPERERRYDRRARLRELATHLEATLPAGISSVCINSTAAPPAPGLLRAERM